MFRRDRASRLRGDLAESDAIDRGDQDCLGHLTQSQVLAQQTAIDHNAMRMFVSVPAGNLMRDWLGVVMRGMIVAVMVMVPMILCRCDRQMGVAWQMRVLAAGPGMNYLTE